MKGEGEQGSVLDGGLAAWGRTGLQQYRYCTVAILRKYLRISLNLGKLPSALGGEIFRSRVTGYRVASFEDMAIFVIDVAGCLSLLGGPAKEFVQLHIFQEYSMEEAAAKMGCDPRNGRRIYEDALDELSEIFLRVGVRRSTGWETKFRRRGGSRGVRCCGGRLGR